jgi:hypothetical protein
MMIGSADSKMVVWAKAGTPAMTGAAAAVAVLSGGQLETVTFSEGHRCRARWSRGQNHSVADMS